MDEALRVAGLAALLDGTTCVSHSEAGTNFLRDLGCIALSQLEKSLRRTLREIPDKNLKKLLRTKATASGRPTEAAKPISFVCSTGPTAALWQDWLKIARPDDGRLELSMLCRLDRRSPELLTGTAAGIVTYQLPHPTD